MMRFLMSATFAAVGLTMLGVTQTPAASPSSGSGHHGSMSGRHDGHHFRASERFGYGRYGYKSLSWTRYSWSSYYRSYCYWAPRYGWCFYEPTYGYYLPVKYHSEVYPEAAQTVAPVVSTTPSVIQQTTVVTVPPAPAVTLPPGPPEAPTPTVVPAPTAVQQTKVGAGAP